MSADNRGHRLHEATACSTALAQACTLPRQLACCCAGPHSSAGASGGEWHTAASGEHDPDIIQRRACDDEWSPGMHPCSHMLGYAASERDAWPLAPDQRVAFLAGCGACIPCPHCMPCLQGALDWQTLAGCLLSWLHAGLLHLVRQLEHIQRGHNAVPHNLQGVPPHLCCSAAEMAKLANI